MRGRWSFLKGLQAIATFINIPKRDGKSRKRNVMFVSCVISKKRCRLGYLNVGFVWNMLVELLNFKVSHNVLRTKTDFSKLKSSYQKIFPQKFLNPSFKFKNQKFSILFQNHTQKTFPKNLSKPYEIQKQFFIPSNNKIICTVIHLITENPC